MKHILPIITLTTLAAAASAQAAAPAGLSYNRVGVSRVNTQTTLSADFLVGGNVLISAVAGNSSDSHGEDNIRLGLGYVFKNVAAGIDATVGLTAGLGYNQDSQNASVYSVNLRRSLSDFAPGLEAAVGYNTTGSTSKEAEISGAYGVYASSYWTVELSYAVTKQISVALGRISPKGDSALTVYSVRYSF
jgi:opacity protein-like surface antigen